MFNYWNCYFLNIKLFSDYEVNIKCNSNKQVLLHFASYSLSSGTIKILWFILQHYTTDIKIV